MTVEIHFYAPFFVLTGTRRTEWPLEADSVGAGEFIGMLLERWPQLERHIGGPEDLGRRLTLVADGKVLGPGDRILRGSTVRILGPLSGG